jgi:hypothetical protein
MTRKSARNYSPSVAVLFIAILTLLIAAAALAQAPVARLRFALQTGGAMQQNTGVPGQRLEHPVVMRTPNAELTSGIPPLHFSKPIPYDPGGSCSSIAVADVNGDGHLDLVVAYWNEGSVGVLLGKGDGTFQPVVKYNSGGTGAPSVAVADLNGDGKPDIVVLNAWGQEGTVGVLLGNGDGTFQPPVTYDTGQYSIPESLAVGDLNGDGHPDIAVANFGHSDCDCNDGRVGVLWGSGDGTFQPTVFYPSGGYDTVSVTIQDGLLLVINLCQDQYCDWPNGSVCVNGNCYDSGGPNPYSVAVGDLNGDGHPDIVVANLLSNAEPFTMTVGVLLNDGWGGFQPVVLHNPGGDYPYLGAVADLNGDGKPDIVVGTRSGTSVLLGNGDGTVQPAVIVGPVMVVGSLSGNLIAADLTGNGKLDLIGIGSVMLNTSGYATTTQIRSSLNPSSLNQPVTFTAAVTSRSRTIPDGELVTFYDGTTAIASVALAGGTAAYSTSTLSARTHSIKARYSGDALLAPSTGSVTQAVLKYTTTTTLSSSPNPSTYGQPVTLTATVTSAGPAPTGTVTFRNGSVILGSRTLNAGGIAALTTTKIPVGTDALTATYNGDASNGKSVSAAITQTVSQASLSMVLTSTPNPSAFGISVKFTAKLTSNGGLPSGQPVTFSYNGATLGTANVNSTGVATFYTTAALPRGSDVVTAAYAGTVDYSSASATVTQVVN